MTDPRTLGGQTSQGNWPCNAKWGRTARILNIWPRECLLIVPTTRQTWKRAMKEFTRQHVDARVSRRRLGRLARCHVKLGAPLSEVNAKEAASYLALHF